MSRVVVLQHAGKHEVWIGLDDDWHPPDGFSFIIGTGVTRDQAVAEAVADLEAALERLQQPPVERNP